MVTSSAVLLKSNKKLYFLPVCEPVLKSYNDILRLVFTVKITTDSLLSFQRVLTSSIRPEIQLRAVAQARLTPAGQRDQLPPLILIQKY